MFEREPGHSAERNIWQAVLLQAVTDALEGVPGGMGNRDTRLRLTEDARRYLTRPSKDLSTVCALAGLDPEAVIERMRKQIAAAPTPEELIGAPRRSRTYEKKPRAPKPYKTASAAIGRNSKEPALIAFNGESLTVKEWSARTGINKASIYFRLGSGWTVEDALTVPNGGKRQPAPEPQPNTASA